MAALSLVALLPAPGCAGQAAHPPAPPSLVAPEVRRLVTYVELPETAYADKDCPRRRYLGPGFPQALQAALQAELARLGMQVTTDAAVPHQLVVHSIMAVESCVGGRACGSLSLLVGGGGKLLSRQKADLPAGPGVLGVCDGTNYPLVPSIAARRTVPGAIESAGLAEFAASLAPDPAVDAGVEGGAGRSAADAGGSEGGVGDAARPADAFSPPPPSLAGG
jgi:hypothetical protein